MSTDQTIANAASDFSGSGAASDPSNGQSGQGSVNLEALVQENENLKKVLGQQGNELGQYRNFVESVEPLAKKLEANPAVFDMIMSDKLNDEVAKMVADGQISKSEGKAVVQAQAEVKRAVETGSAVDIDKAVEEKLAKATERMEANLMSKVEEFRSEQGQIADAAEFIESAADFSEYAEEVDKYLSAHDTTDVAEAYYAVKGRVLTQLAAQKAEVETSELAKRAATGAVPGTVSGRRQPMSANGMEDALFGTSTSPTSLI